MSSTSCACGPWQKSVQWPAASTARVLAIVKANAYGHGASVGREFQTPTDFYLCRPAQRAEVHLGVPRFSGQTKDTLANAECNGTVTPVTYQLLTKFQLLEENPKEKEAKAAIMRPDRTGRVWAAAAG